MKLTFIYLAPFVADCRRLRLSEEDLRQLELAILANPEIGKVVAGTGGLRKMRFAPESSGRGKSGGIRVGYTLFRFADSAYFIAAYGKNEKSDLSPRERKVIRSLIHNIENQLRRQQP